MALTPPTFLRQGDAFCYSFPEVGELGTMIVLDQLREGRDSLDAEITVQTFLGVNGTDKPGRIDWFSLNLKAAQTRERAAKSLAAATQQPEAQWSEMLKHAVMRTVEEHRRGEPVVDLAMVDAPQSVPYLMYPTLMEGETSMVIADGKSGKSFYALMTAVAVARKTGLPGGIEARKSAKVLYLDWEASQAAHARRLDWICRGLGIDRGSLEGKLFYRRMWLPLSADRDRIKKEIERLGIGLVIVDSVGGAAEDELKNTTAARTLFNAVRLFNTTVLLIHHLSKMEASGEGPSTPFGSVYFKNYARYVDEIKSTRLGPGQLGLSIWNRWVNDGEVREHPIGWRVTFDTENRRATVVGFQVSSSQKLSQGGGNEYLLRTALSSGEATIDDLAKATGISGKLVDKTLRRMGDVEIAVQGGPGRGRINVWKLRVD